MNTRFTSVRSIVAATAFLGVSAAALMASARTIPPDNGFAVFFSDASCFQATAGSIAQNCTGTRPWEIPLVVDNAGSKTVTITVLAPDISHNLSCAANATDANGNNLTTSGQKSPSVFGTPQALALTSFNLPANGRGWAGCSMSQTSQVITVNYNQ
jgi:hypothetical protein